MSDGYARNYLIPNGLAEAATEKRIKEVEQQQKVMQSELKEHSNALSQLATSLDGQAIEIQQKANNDGTLFGAVHESAILQELKQRSIEVEESWIRIAEPIKTVGDHTVHIAIPGQPERLITVRINA